MARSAGKHAFGFCDRTGKRWPLSDLMYEYVNGTRTGLRIGPDVFDKDHPQNFLGRVRIDDDQSLTDPRPDQGQEESRRLYGWSPVGNPAIILTGSVGSVTVVVTEGA